MKNMWWYVVLILFGIAAVVSKLSAVSHAKTLSMVQEVEVPVVYLAEVEPEENEEYELTTEEQECELLCDSLDLLALCVMAEAEGESELGKRLVIDTVLNRVDHPDFPDTIWDVITYPGAFTSYRNGRMDRVEPTQEIYRLICEERRNRTNTEVLYFNSGNYPAYGEPLLQEGNHYFNGEEA